jgi:nickel transport protein
MIRIILTSLALLLLATLPAAAHKLKLFAQAEGSDVVGTAYFAGGGKAAGVEGWITAPDGAVAGRFQTDAEGGFRIAVTRRQDYVVAVDSTDGHAASTLVAAADLSPALPEGQVRPPDPSPALPRSNDNAALEEALARQLRPLRQQIDTLESRTRLADIIGGIGFIFGLFGIAAWISARREKRS